eukprot:TRINITY_DN25962_c0_g1_i1.p1 TRINITY_DN25962_c0_g1~~TRINITY_DN25962_c0_g1_i1.p1  ORF type:complete len:156 (-),score=16.59 TRINITY_DN25962_c0_g1_i1:6-452(-)
MEVNCRTFGNQLPVFSRLYSPTHCMLSAALDLLQGRLPPFAASMPYATATCPLLDTSICPALASLALPASQRLSAALRAGVCLYVDPVQNVPEWIECPGPAAGDALLYYAPQARPCVAYVWAVSNGEVMARDLAKSFYARLVAGHHIG